MHRVSLWDAITHRYDYEWQSMIYSSILNITGKALPQPRRLSLILHREEFQNQPEVVVLLSKLFLDLLKSGKDFGSDVFRDSPTILYAAHALHLVPKKSFVFHWHRFLSQPFSEDGLPTSDVWETARTYE